MSSKPARDHESLALMSHTISLQLEQMAKLYNHAALAGAMFAQVALLHSELRQRGIIDVHDLSRIYEDAMTIAMTDDPNGLPMPGPVPSPN
jgi:hypothetical protein